MEWDKCPDRYLVQLTAVGAESKSTIRLRNEDDGRCQRALRWFDDALGQHTVNLLLLGLSCALSGSEWMRGVMKKLLAGRESFSENLFDI